MPKFNFRLFHLANNKPPVTTLDRVHWSSKTLPFFDVTSRTSCLKKQERNGRPLKNLPSDNKTPFARSSLPSSVERRLNACVRTFHVENRWRPKTIKRGKRDLKTGIEEPQKQSFQSDSQWIFVLQFNVLLINEINNLIKTVLSKEGPEACHESRTTSWVSRLIFARLSKTLVFKFIVCSLMRLRIVLFVIVVVCTVAKGKVVLRNLF